MGLVQIEETELAVLRKERDDAKAEATKVPTLVQEKAAAVTAAEAAEAAKTAAETALAASEAKLVAATETAAKAALKETRWSGLGGQFVAKLGDFTKGRLQEQAGTLDDAEWDNRLKELEESTAVKRDAKADSSEVPTAGKTLLDGGEFTAEELAAASPGLIPAPGAPAGRAEQAQVVAGLGKLFAKTA